MPSFLWPGIWKRFHMFTADDPGTGALARTVVGTHSRGHLDRFPTDFLIACPASDQRSRKRPAGTERQKVRFAQFRRGGEVEAGEGCSNRRFGFALAAPIEEWPTTGHLASMAGHADSGRPR
jgi:hypothetical protein